ncbi:MAG: hypothetical protein QM811_25570 [Pirellulales bacterium]
MKRSFGWILAALLCVDGSLYAQAVGGAGAATTPSVPAGGPVGGQVGAGATPNVGANGVNLGGSINNQGTATGNVPAGGINGTAGPNATTPNSGTFTTAPQGTPNGRTPNSTGMRSSSGNNTSVTGNVGTGGFANPGTGPVGGAVGNSRGITGNTRGINTNTGSVTGNIGAGAGRTFATGATPNVGAGTPPFSDGTTGNVGDNFTVPTTGQPAGRTGTPQATILPPGGATTFDNINGGPSALPPAADINGNSTDATNPQSPNATIPSRVNGVGPRIPTETPNPGELGRQRQSMIDQNRTAVPNAGSNPAATGNVGASGSSDVPPTPAAAANAAMNADPAVNAANRVMNAPTAEAARNAPNARPALNAAAAAGTPNAQSAATAAVAPNAASSALRTPQLPSATNANRMQYFNNMWWYARPDNSWMIYRNNAWTPYTATGTDTMSTKTTINGIGSGNVESGTSLTPGANEPRVINSGVGTTTIQNGVISGP